MGISRARQLEKLTKEATKLDKLRYKFRTTYSRTKARIRILGSEEMKNYLTKVSKGIIRMREIIVEIEWEL